MEHMPPTEWARPVVYFEIEALDENILIPFYKEMFNWEIVAVQSIAFLRELVALKMELVDTSAKANAAELRSTYK